MANVMRKLRRIIAVIFRTGRRPVQCTDAELDQTQFTLLEILVRQEKEEVPVFPLPIQRFPCCYEVALEDTGVDWVSERGYPVMHPSDELTTDV